ncbi:MAG: hypothetical protein ABSE19_09030 [Candidatus Acidiferrum sp.]|jgi:hypothetical protein
MSDTTSSGANGKIVNWASVPSTGGDLDPGKQARIVKLPPSAQPSHQTLQQQPLEPAKLYEFFSRETGSFEVDVPIAIASRAFGESLERMRAAMDEPDQLERENHISLAWSKALGLARFVGTWPAFDEALSILFTVFEGHRTIPYRTSELIGLQKVLEILRRNPLPGDEGIGLIFDSLVEAGFDLNAPLAGLTLDEDSEEI